MLYVGAAIVGLGILAGLNMLSPKGPQWLTALFMFGPGVAGASGESKLAREYGEGAMWNSLWIVVAVTIGGGAAQQAWKMVTDRARRELESWALQSDSWIRESGRFETYRLSREIKRLQPAEAETVRVLLTDSEQRAYTCREARHQIEVARSILA